MAFDEDGERVTNRRRSLEVDPNATLADDTLGVGVRVPGDGVGGNVLREVLLVTDHTAVRADGRRRGVDHSPALADVEVVSVSSDVSCGEAKY